MNNLASFKRIKNNLITDKGSAYGVGAIIDINSIPWNSIILINSGMSSDSTSYSDVVFYNVKGLLIAKTFHGFIKLQMVSQNRFKILQEDDALRGIQAIRII
ncbi:hypothetical protein [Fusobacterium hominis]|uniref:Uncharacterized protein n=1 Tax=Fusobacterium hominis TaxID=2764326 RepID=A0A7G9GXJ6_9FUSO|nr:hypothetical protein [Fusobacterium hominis]QNM15528.1 hypothetical protein H9Q81_01420 [Fusobacterium hominis]